jgi:hypothetical protein
MCAPGVDLLAHTDALDKVDYGGVTVGGLSALARLGQTDTYAALSDRGGWVFTLAFSVSGDAEITGAVQLRDASDAPYADTAIDGEGLVVLPSGELLVASEVEPSIRHHAADGQFVSLLRVPERFLVQPLGLASPNATFESLALAPSGQRLFTAVEQPLVGDGTTSDGGGRIRILRYDLLDGAFQPAAEYLYLAERDQGVSEIVALSDTELLVLERGLSLVSGFSARVLRVSLDGAENVSSIERLEDADARPVPKELLVDLAECRSEGASLAENFESMALGSRQGDSSQTLIVGSDDNYQTFQVTRFLIVAFHADAS